MVQAQRRHPLRKDSLHAFRIIATVVSFPGCVRQRESRNDPATVGCPSTAGRVRRGSHSAEGGGTQRPPNSVAALALVVVVAQRSRDPTASALSHPGMLTDSRPSGHVCRLTGRMVDVSLGTRLNHSKDDH